MNKLTQKINNKYSIEKWKKNYLKMKWRKINFSTSSEGIEKSKIDRDCKIYQNLNLSKTTLKEMEKKKIKINYI